MKFLFLLTFLLTMGAFAQDDCLRFMNGAKRAQFLFKKQCQMIVEDQGATPVHEIDGCFSKLRNQFPNQISYAFVGDLKTDKKYDKNLIIFNTVDARETPEEIRFSVQVMSPELLALRTKIEARFDKETEELSLTVDEGRFKMKNKYQLKVVCR